ncbi:MAG: hypothetical protein EOL95_09880 [Bacteroidia bacterium]|nr:hypothetical protein [Bacteroidia bacterium]
MQTKNYIIISASVIVLITAIALTFYFVGKKKVNNVAKLPDQTNWGNELDDTENLEIQKHSRKLYEDMKGLNFLSRDASIYSEYLASSDRVFVGAANYFAQTYGKGENLAQWLDSENFAITNIGLSTTIDSIMGRLAKYGITA